MAGGGDGDGRVVIPGRRRVDRDEVCAGRRTRGGGGHEKLRKLMDQLSSAKLLLSAPQVTDTVWTG